ncbi:hypothetical protein [Jeongeupia chitinilytica]|uniref:Zinc ribbon domain-containing protein n=1 Tax=Jeongeupia chitinilytica TaxID=1041641 RepID=A0ABQ3GXD3_9NEIS|nr:hypothetical protein [Jeongeupia chitinilytica]GHD56002.1 hypothetical protein GCM10007350_02310 [Jeongeupia chitinilytica]
MPLQHRVMDDGTGAWKPVPMSSVAMVLLLTVWLLYFALSGDRWVPLLDGANLLIHEAGHPVFGVLSERLMVYGGTLGQLVFPLAALYQFRRQRDAVGSTVAVIWLGENGLNIGRYMADARAQLLLLVGNGDRLHDWTDILSRWGLLRFDTMLGSLLRLLGVLLILAALVWLFQQARRAKPMD